METENNNKIKYIYAKMAGSIHWLLFFFWFVAPPIFASNLFKVVIFVYTSQQKKRGALHCKRVKNDNKI